MPSLDVTLGKVNEALFPVPVMLICCYYEPLQTARHILRREWKACCCIASQETYEVSQPATSADEVHSS